MTLVSAGMEASWFDVCNKT